MLGDHGKMLVFYIRPHWKQILGIQLQAIVGEQLEGIHRCCECKFLKWCATKLEVNSKQVEENDKDSQNRKVEED